MTRLGWTLGAGIFLAQACADPKDDQVVTTNGVTFTGGADSTSGGDPTTGAPPDDFGFGGDRQVDILFVIDNSGSMAEEQARLAQNFAAFLGVLEAPGVDADYRIGITTTDAGNPRCPNTTPENGTLVLSSCLDRVAQGEFKYGAEDFSAACTDYCGKTGAQLQVKPTTTQYDAQPAPRRWIERSAGQSNIGGVASNAEAFQCYGPQGVAGCGFESHLESMYRALAKASDPAATANYGFLRDAAALAIVIVSDETDCSYQQAQKDVFIGNKVFWNDPDDPQPTSALCWRAGVECSGASPYSECHAANYGLDGKPGAADADAVLGPVGKYIDFVKSIEAARQSIDLNRSVQVALITGVPVGYETFAKALVYKDAADPVVQANYGIGPGCVLGPASDPEATAVPPVREREFAEAFLGDSEPERNLYSICQPDYSAALGSIAAEIRDQLGSLCMLSCVRDTVPATDALEPQCQVYEELPDDTRSEVALCDEVDGEWTPPAGKTLCVALRTDRSATTPSKIDGMSRTCIARGANLELLIVRTAPGPAGAFFSASCAQSTNKAEDCPLL